MSDAIRSARRSRRRRTQEAATLEAAARALGELQWRARDGEREAVLALVEHARKACMAVYRVWECRTFMMTGDDVAADAAAEHRCRSILRGLAQTMTSFPVLHYADVNANQQTIDMIAGLSLGSAIPFKTSRRRADYAKSGATWLLTAYIYPKFEAIRGSRRPSGKIEERIWQLPPLSKATAAQWVRVAADWVIDFYGPDSQIVRDWAKPEHELGKKNRWSLLRIRKKFNGVDDPIGLTKKQIRLNNIATRQPTVSDLKIRLRQVLTERMKTVLRG